MLSCAYLRRQAALCLRIAAAVEDQSVVAALVVMADDFSVKADEVDPSLGPTSLGPTSLGPTSLRPTSLGSNREAAVQGSNGGSRKAGLMGK
jgi:hypothetical protein